MFGTNFDINHFLRDQQYDDYISSLDRAKWYSILVGFFTGSPHLDKISDLQKMGQDHFLLLFRSLRGEKNDNAAINNENICPSIDSLGFGPNDGYS